MIIKTNKDIYSKYSRKLRIAIRWMGKSVEKEIHALYKKNEKDIVWDTPAEKFSALLNKIIKKYENAFNKRAEVYAEDLVQDVSSDLNRKIEKEVNSIRKAKNSNAKYFKFKSTPQSIVDIQSAIIAENVSLIKSIPKEYLQDVESTVYESLSRGNDLSKFSEELESKYGIARRRADIIARDQTDKATSYLGIKKAESIGVTKARWVHSGAGKTPRESHVNADGKVFSLDKGLKIDGEFIFPAELINCRCSSDLIFDFLED